MNIAIIPARGGSKRIKKKNIKLFNNYPIIYWSIMIAKKSKLFNKIIVSTDDIEISKIAKKYGADIPFFRPKYLSDDYTHTNTVVKHALKYFIKKKINYEYCCCIYPTSPFIKIKYLKEGLTNVKKKYVDYSFPITEYKYPIQRALKIDKNKKIYTFNNKRFPKTSNFLKKSYHDVGQFYWGKSSAFLNNKKLMEKKSLGILIPNYLSHDIDNIDDWKRAELYFNLLN